MKKAVWEPYKFENPQEAESRYNSLIFGGSGNMTPAERSLGNQWSNEQHIRKLFNELERLGVTVIDDKEAHDAKE